MARNGICKLTVGLRRLARELLVKMPCTVTTSVPIIRYVTTKGGVGWYNELSVGPPRFSRLIVVQGTLSMVRSPHTSETRSLRRPATVVTVRPRLGEHGLRRRYLGQHDRSVSTFWWPRAGMRADNSADSSADYAPATRRLRYRQRRRKILHLVAATIARARPSENQRLVACIHSTLSASVHAPSLPAYIDAVCLCS